MKKVYHQPYTKNRATSCWYGKPEKGIFKYDIIKVKLPSNDCKKCGDYIYITPDEGADIIRAISAGLHHFLVNDVSVSHIIKAKTRAEKQLFPKI